MDDDSHLKVLQVVSERTTKKLKSRITIAASIETRVNDREAAMQEIQTKHAVAEAAFKAVQQEFEALRQRVEGSLASAVPDCDAKVEETTKALEVVKTVGEDWQSTLRHGEEAERLLLQSQQTEEASLKQVLLEARTAIAEAREDVALASDDIQGSRGDAQMETKIREAEACLLDCERRDQEATEAHQKATIAAQHVKSQLDDSGDGEMDDEIMQQFKVQHQQQIALVEATLQERAQASKEATQAKIAAQEEVESLRKQQEMAHFASNLEKLVLEEIAIVDKGLRAHKDKEHDILEGAKQKMADWTKEKENLGAELHRTQLKVTMAEDSLKSTNSLVESLWASALGA